MDKTKCEKCNEDITLPLWEWRLQTNEVIKHYECKKCGNQQEEKREEYANIKTL